MTITKDNYEQCFKQGLADGFDVVGAEQHYDTNDNMNPKLEQLICTPWNVGGNPVYGYSKINISSSAEHAYGYRRIESHEFWIYDPQGKPVHLENAYPNGYTLEDGQGNRLSADEAFSIHDDFACAASYHPHVFSAPEFAEARNYLNGRMGLPEVTASDYEEYLKHMKEQMNSGNFIFTGRIRTPEDMSIAYQSMEGMDTHTKKRRFKLPKIF